MRQRSYVGPGPASDRLPLSVAAASRSHSCPSPAHLDGRRRKPKRDETMWRAVASCKGSWNNRRRNLATVPESLQVAACVNDKRSDARRVCSGSARLCVYASADTIGFIVSVAAASSSACWRCGVDRRRISFASAGPVSLSRINGRLGQ
jgi:hypothetical protein